MSRIGKKPVIIPNGVTVTIEGDTIKVKGSKGELSFIKNESMEVVMSEKEINVKRKNNEKNQRSLHGLTRVLIQNMIKGVSEGFNKRLEVNGVGYRFQIQGGKKIILSLGFSHPIEYIPREGVELKPDEEKKNIIIVSGIDKEKVGQVAAEIRAFRPPEPYKGKGIKYETETIQRKAGKTAAKTA